MSGQLPKPFQVYHEWPSLCVSVHLASATFSTTDYGTVGHDGFLLVLSTYHNHLQQAWLVINWLYLALFLPKLSFRISHEQFHSLDIFIAFHFKEWPFSDLVSNSGEVLTEVLWTEKSFFRLFCAKLWPSWKCFLIAMVSKFMAVFINSGSRP